MKSKVILFVCAILTIPALVLGSCGANPPSEPNEVSASPTPKTNPQSQSTAEIPVSSVPQQLNIWIPDELIAPDTEGITALLEKQITKFSVQNPSTKVELRVKKSTGKGNLLDTLQGASLAAPDSLPDLVLLSSSDMETSALKGLLIPFDGSTDILSSTDWAGVTRELSQVQGSNFGIPVLADVTTLATKKNANTDESIYKIDRPVSVYLNDSRAQFLMGLYLSGGGKLQQDPGRPEMDVEVLTKAISLIDSGFRANAFSSDTLKINSNDQAAKLFLSDQGDQYIGWYSSLSSESDTFQIASVPGIDGQSASIARGWFWSVSNPDPLRRQSTIQLVEVLSEPEFLAEFADLVGLIPVRESVELNQNKDLSIQFQVLNTAHPEPNGVILVTTGSALRDAILQSQRGDLSPAEIADGVVKSFIRP